MCGQVINIYSFIAKYYNYHHVQKLQIEELTLIRPPVVKGKKSP